MKTRCFSLTSRALAAAFLTAPLNAAEKPVEGPIDPFRGEAKCDIQQLFTRLAPGERSGGRYPNLAVTGDGTVPDWLWREVGQHAL